MVGDDRLPVFPPVFNEDFVRVMAGGDDSRDVKTGNVRHHICFIVRRYPRLCVD